MSALTGSSDHNRTRGADHETHLRSRRRSACCGTRSRPGVTCGDYSLMDDAKQMETIAADESLTSKLAADCKDRVDVLVIDLVKGYRS